MSNLLLSLRDEGRRGSPAASHFLLSRQKKVTQEKATQVRRPFGLPCGTRPEGPLRNSPSARAQTVLADTSLPVCVPRRTHMGLNPDTTLIPTLLPEGEGLSLSSSVGKSMAQSLRRLWAP